jgi:hypothetical protein
MKSMRTPQAKYANNPLKKLRTILELSQEAFSKWAGISLDQVRSFEIGRRGDGTLSEEMRSNIFKTCGAIWDEETKTWLYALFFFGGGPAVPYHKTHFEGFKNELKKEASERSVLIYRTLFEIMRLMEEIPSTAFNGFFWRFEQLLNDWTGEFATPALVKDFQRVALELAPIMDKDCTRVEGYRKICRGLFTLGEEKGLTMLIKEARDANEALMETAEIHALRRFRKANPEGGVWTIPDTKP